MPEIEVPFDFDLDRFRDFRDLEFERDLRFDFDPGRKLVFPLDVDFDSAEEEVGRARFDRCGERLRDFLFLLGDFDKDLQQK